MYYLVKVGSFDWAVYGIAELPLLTPSKFTELLCVLLSAPLYNLSDLDDNDIYLRAPQPADGIDKGGQGH